MSTKIVERDLDVTVQARLSFMASLQGFGAKGDGVADDTAAIVAAIQYIADTGNSVVVPPGTYMSDPVTVNIVAYARQGSFIGVDAKRCIIKRRTPGTGIFFTVGSPTGTSFQVGMGISDLTIDGGAKTNGPAYAAYDLVRTRFTNPVFIGGSTSCRLYGGISVVFNSPRFEQAIRGLEIIDFASQAGGGWPNIITVNGGEAVDNEQWGVFFNGGRMLCMSRMDIEGNGIALNGNSGGIYVGPNVGREVSSTTSLSKGIVLREMWFEANKGTADIAMDSGDNTLTDCLFFSNGGEVQNNILVNGGKYTLRNCSAAHAMSANLMETGSVLSGNLVDMCQLPNLTYNGVRTTVRTGKLDVLMGGSVMAMSGMTRPLVQRGRLSTTATGSIVFPIPYKVGTTPIMMTHIYNDSPTTIDQVDVYSFGRLGFTYRKKSMGSGGVITNPNYTVDWMVVGEID